MQRVPDEAPELHRQRFVQMELRAQPAICSGIVWNSLSISCTGSPGTSCSIENTSSETPSSTGIVAATRRARIRVRTSALACGARAAAGRPHRSGAPPRHGRSRRSFI